MSLIIAVIPSTEPILKIFDQYHGSQIPDGFYSISIGLLFQHPQRTLQDDELNPMLAELLSRLDEKFEIKQRGG